MISQELLRSADELAMRLKLPLHAHDEIPIRDPLQIQGALSQCKTFLRLVSQWLPDPSAPM